MPMNISAIVEKLTQTTERRTICDDEHVTNRDFWIQAHNCYKQASLEDRCKLVDALDRCISRNPSVLSASSGLELFIPIFWESLVLSHECSAQARTIFRLLSHLVSKPTDVRFGDSMNHVLASTLHFVWTNPLDTLEDLDFVTALIAQARKEEISVEFALSKMLHTFAPSLSDSDQHVWKRVLLVARMIDELQPLVVQQALPSWSTPVATFVVQCLQVKRVTQSSSCRYVLFELLAALSRYTHDSLDWLRPLCAQSDSGQPFAVILTTTIVEIKLGLSRSTTVAELSSRAPVAGGDCKKAITLIGASNTQSKQLEFVPNPTVLRCAVLKNASEILRLCLLDLKEANSNSETDINSTTCLAQLMSDESVQGSWLQLIDLGEAVREYLSFFTGSSECAIEKIPEEFLETRDVNDSILCTYLVWMELYFETHHDEILANSNADETDSCLLELGRRLLKEGLSSIGPILWSRLSSYFCASTKQSQLTIVERYLSSLEFFSSLIPGLPIFPFSFTVEIDGNQITLGHLASCWLWSVWTDSDPSHLFSKRAMLNLLTLVNNAWLGPSLPSRDSHVHEELFQWIRDPESFSRRVLDTSLPQPTKNDVGIHLDLNVEVLILCILSGTSRCTPANACSLSNSTDHVSSDVHVPSDHSRVLADVSTTTHDFLRLLEHLATQSHEDSAAFQALHQRLKTALQKSTEILPVFAHKHSS